MITIRADQVDAILRAAFDRQARAFTRRLEIERPELGDAAAELVAQAKADAEVFALTEPQAFERYLTLVASLGDEERASPWAPFVAWVLSNGAHSAKDRLDFVERYLIPRIRNEESLHGR